MSHRYGYTEEHELYRRTARAFFDKELDPHYRRYAAAGGVDKEFWRKAGSAGLLGSGIPEEYGGPGGDFVFNVILAEELGRSVGSALTGSSLMADMATNILMAHGTDAQKKKYAAGILAGEIQMNISSPASTVGFVTSGKLRALARTGLKRMKVLPDVPTVAESGYPGFEAIQWYGFIVPGATPKNVVARIREDTMKALRAPDVQAAMERLGLEPDATAGPQLTARLKKETAMWAGIIKEAGIRLQ